MTASRGRQGGVALAIVVWFIAGMSLLVAGIVLSARTDVRMAQMHLGRAQASAAGDGAINLLMADLMDGAFRTEAGARLAQQSYTLGGIEVAVVAVPADWLVNANRAAVPVLANMLRLSGAAGPGEARGMALAVVQWRDRAAGLASMRLDAPEDLLGAPGMTRAAWDSLRDYVGVQALGAAQAQPGPRAQLALQRLRKVDPAARVANEGMRAPGLGAGTSSVALYRVDAIARLGDRYWLRRRWVRLSGGFGAFPWRVMRTEPARIISAGP